MFPEIQLDKIEFIQGMNITVQSYNGRLDFGILVDRDLVPDVWSITDMLHESMEELLSVI